MEKLMINCTAAITGIVNSVLKYRTNDNLKLRFPSNTGFIRVVQSYAIQEMTKTMQSSPFRMEHCVILEKVIERLTAEGYLSGGELL